MNQHHQQLTRNIALERPQRGKVSQESPSRKKVPQSQENGGNPGTAYRKTPLPLQEEADFIYKPEAESLLLFAVRNGQIEVVKLLLECMRNKVELLFEHKVDVEGRVPQLDPQNEGQYVETNASRERREKYGTPLIIAASKGYHEIVKLLIYHLADINATDENGFTAMHHAAYEGHIECIDTLLKKTKRKDKTTCIGSLDPKTSYGTTPPYAGSWQRKERYG